MGSFTGQSARNHCLVHSLRFNKGFRTLESYCADEPIFFATSQDLNNTPTFDLPDSAIEWSVAGGALSVSDMR